MKKYDLIDLESAGKLLAALVLLESFLVEIRSVIHVLETFRELDEFEGPN